MTELNIVELIEKNPITKLNGSYQSKLIEKIQKTFNNYEQQIFLASFYCYLKYDNKNDFVIDLDNVWKWLGFQQKYHAKYLLEKQFTINYDYKIFAPEGSGAKKSTRGGHNKEIIMLNIDTFKKFCLKAGTKKADEIHDYFIKLEQILHEIIEEESNELRLQLENQNNKLLESEQKIKEQQIQLKNQKILEREKILLNEYATIGSIFYIIKVKTYENGHYIIKIGESRKGIIDRYKEHKTKYEECLLLDCFVVKQSKNFETFIKEHELIRNNRVNNLLNHEKELELFYIGKNLSYDILIEIINNNLKYFNNSDTEKLELEIEKLKILLEMNDNSNNNLLLNDLNNNIKQLTQKINNIENTNIEIKNKLNSLETKTTTKTTTNFNIQMPTIGPRLQKINPETMTIVKIYETVSECLHETNYKLKRPSIDKAIKNNTIYNGFRWCYVDRNLDPNIIYNNEPTKITKKQNIGYVAKLNKEKTEILNVYINRKVAAQENNYISSSALDNHVKNMTFTKGFYYILYDLCSDDLKIKFEEKNEKPFLYKDGIGQFSINNELIQKFICKYDCIQKLKISDKTLNKAIKNNLLYNNYYYKEIGSKYTVL